MSTTDRVVPCAESPMLTDAIATAEQTMLLMNQLLENPGLANAGLMQKLNHHSHQAQIACDEAFKTIKAR